MTTYALVCDKEHEFEGWFRSSSDYDDQLAKKLLSCPYCGSTKITKGIMAPNVATGRRKDAARDEKLQKTVIKALKEVRQHVEQNSDYVGEKFAYEARAMHYGDVEERSIYGEATKDDVEELKEEGIDVASIPWVDIEEH
ncbi:MAG: DUF1178 family protein [Alphaproteobacteria bacterium]